MVTLAEAVTRGLAPDRGLYMPERIPTIPRAFFNNIAGMNLQEIAYVVASTLFGDTIDHDSLKAIVNDTLNFDIPAVKVEDDIYSLELFHGPTLAFKDVGARFMARLLSHFNQSTDEEVNVLVATSGDTGSAVANGFLNVPGVKVWVLYPKGKVSKLQEAQFTTLGGNITALEIRGNFDDCQAMVKAAFLDEEINSKMKLTSANSINVARFLPQMFYYFHAYAQLLAAGVAPDRIVVAVPSGNFGNLTAGLIGHRMGLPIKRFVAANNANDVFVDYLNTGNYTPRKSLATIANAMDVGDPSNFARILDLYGHSHQDISHDITGYAYTDSEISRTMHDAYQRTGYILDPHGATAYQALKDTLKPGETGIFLETAHPAKFIDTVTNAIGTAVVIPERLERFARGHKSTIKINNTFSALKSCLLNQ